MHPRSMLLVSLLGLGACARPDGAYPAVDSRATSSPAFASNDPLPKLGAPAGSPAISARVVGHGPPMILIPGLACSGRVWDGMVARYADRYEIHVLTLAGFAGVAPSDHGGDWLTENATAVAEYVTAHRLERPIVVGHSLGGILAYDLASTSPELLGPIVAVDAVPFLPALRDPGATPDSVRPIAARMRDTIVHATPAAARVRNRRALASMITDPAAVERAAMWEDASDPQTIGRAMFDVMTTDLRPKMGKIRSPLLLVGAGNLGPIGPTADDVERAYAEQIDAVPDHAVVVDPKSKHFVMLDDPAFLFAKIDAFLGAKAPRR